MNTPLLISSIIFLLLVIIFILRYVRLRKISIKYSLIWLFPCVLLFLFVLVPGFMKLITKLTGFQTASNMILTFLVLFLFVINIALTIIVTNQKDKIRLLIQEVSMIKEKVNK